MGVGKTTVGKKLAKYLDFEFIDLDDIFEQKYKISIDSFFNKYDEELFRKMEHEMLLETFSKQNAVISTGGGTPCFHNAMEKINSTGLSIYIRMAPSAIANRLSNSKRKRPLVEGIPKEELKNFIKDKLAGRKPIYNQARLHIDGIDVNIQELSAIIKEQLKIS